MFERFTERAIRTIMLAQEESRRSGHKFVGTEQILIGLMRADETVDACFQSVGATLERVRQEVEAIIGRGTGATPEEIPFTPRAKRLLDLAWDEAQQLKSDKITAGHLLLGLLREHEGVAARVLENLGIDCVALKKQVVQRVSTPTADIESPEPPGEGSLHDALTDALDSVRRAKVEAIRVQEFELAACLREQETILAEKIRHLLHKD